MIELKVRGEMRQACFGLGFGLLMSLSVCGTVYAAEKVELHGHDSAIVDKLNRRGITKEPSRAAVPGFGTGKSYLHSFRGEVLDLGADNSFNAFRENTDMAKVKHTRYRQMYKNIPVFAKEFILHEDQSGSIRNVNGNIVKGIEQDLDPKVPLVPAFSATEALEHVKAQLTQDSLTKRRRHSSPESALTTETPVKTSGHFSYRNEQSELNIYIDINNKPRLVYYVNYLAEPAEGGEPSRPHLLIDARTKEIVKRWEGLTHQTIGTGPGGNAKVGQYEYGTNYGFLDVLQNGTLCSMQNSNVMTVNMTGMSDSYATPFSYDCPRNTVKFINGAYSPLNDAHYFGGVIVNMYTTWYGFPPISLPLVMRPHYGTDYENAFWDGQYTNFGDGDSTLYPMVSLDVVAHEVSHGFTEQNSNLLYYGESGGINESFSDMAGESAKYFFRGSNDWKAGADVVKDAGAFRHMDYPPADHFSIDDYSNYRDSLDVHYSSGLFNKAFYLLAIKPGWNTKKAFDVMVKANKDYWVSASTFNSAACGAISAATDLSYGSTDVDDAFRGVNIHCGSPDISTTALPPAVVPFGSYTFTNVSVSFSQKFIASGGTLPFSWSIKSGSLPSGLSLSSSTGEVYGTPADTGSNRFTLQVVDSQGRKNFIIWTIVVDSGLRTGWPKELARRSGSGLLPESYSPVINDLDGDGKDEIVVSDVNTLYVFYSDGTSRNIVLPGKVTTPVVADLDGDGRKEIIVSVQSSNNSIYAFNSDLSPVIGFPAGAYSADNRAPCYFSSPVVVDFDNNGQLKIAVVAMTDPYLRKNVVIMVDSHGQMVPGWPQIFGTYNDDDSPPAVGDIDRDGKKELVFATTDGYIRIFRADGTLLNQWQFDTDTIGTWSPVLADMDGDGYLDVIVKYHKYQSATHEYMISVMNRNGTFLPGWPKVRDGIGSEPFGPIVADIDGDGQPEIVFVDGGMWNELQALRGDGTSPPGWPVVIPWESLGQPIFNCYPLVADIDGDGKQEVLLTTVDLGDKSGRLLAYDANGFLLSGFPKYASPANEIRSTAAIGDIDGNGKLDLVVKSENGFLFAWEMPQNGGGFERQWPMFRNNAQHSGMWVTDRLGLTPTTYDFQNVLSGTSSVMPFTISNPLYGDVTFSSISISGPDSSMFSVKPGTCGNLPINLIPMQGCTANISFTPTSTGTKNAILTATSTSQGLVPVQVLLSGTGTLSSYNLNYTKSGNGKGKVTSSTGTIFSNTGSETIPAGTVVVLTADPEPDFVFTGWEGSCTETGVCTVTMNGDKQVIATFANSTAGVYELNILRSGPGNGTVVYSPGGACPSLCSHLYGAGAVVTLTPTISTDSVFTGWTGCDSVSGTTCTVTMTAIRDVTAKFSKKRAIAAGHYFTLNLYEDGNVWAWGENDGGQLGDGTNTSSNRPVLVPEFKGVIKLAAGYEHALAMKQDGTVWSWGYNNLGQIGDGTYSRRNKPVSSSRLSGAIAIAAGSFHSVAVKGDGTVWTWGYNSNGQLGDGTTTLRTSPVQVQSLSGIIAVAAGNNFTLALKDDGTVWSWGDNSKGQLGDGTTTQRTAPVQVLDLSGVKAIAAGDCHAIALESDGSVRSWGDNYYRQLGDGTDIQRMSPVKVLQLSAVKKVAAGAFHSLAINEDTTVKAWGANWYGQLGDGGIQSITSVSDIAAGFAHSVALKEDGTTWTWGYNWYGQLGDGTNSTESSPVQVEDLAPDNTPPIATVSGAPISPTNATIATLSVGGTDVVTYRYKLDAGSYSAETAVATSITLTSLSDGTHTVSVIVKDSAGNWQVTPTTVSWIVDITLPVTTTVLGAGIYTDPQNVALACNDGSGRGCATTYYCLGSGCTPTSIYRSAIPVSTSTDLRFYSKDVAGNSESVKTATYTINYTLTVVAASTGSGSINATPAGIVWKGNTGSATYAAGTSVILTPAADAGFVFASWTGCDSVSGTQCTVAMASAKSITATFDLVPVDGACGSSNNASLAAAPSTNLCSTGTASTVTGSGPWSWTCAGIGGGTTTSCSAAISKSGIVNPAPGKTVPDLTDALRALNIVVGNVSPTAADLAQLDVAPLDSSGRPKGDNVIDTYDVIGILRMMVGLL